MHLVAFRIVAPSPPVALDEARALRVALEQAVHAHRSAEHVRVHTSHGGALGVLFMLAGSSAEARTHCLSLCAQALADAPQLSGWRVEA